MASEKYVFLYALIITVIFFNIGIYFGYQLESSRVNEINNWYLSSEIELLDQRLQSDAMGFLELDCSSLVDENIKFADRVFLEAQDIQRFEDANRINSEIVEQHKRFDLLRTLFWINSIKIKQKCSSNYHNVVYFYDYMNPSVEQMAKQDFFSNLLLEIKKEKGDNVMLIPIAADNDLSSINLLLEKYELTEFPVIFIDEKIKVTDVRTIDDVMKYLS